MHRYHRRSTPSNVGGCCLMPSVIILILILIVAMLSCGCVECDCDKPQRKAKRVLPPLIGDCVQHRTTGEIGTIVSIKDDYRNSGYSRETYYTINVYEGGAGVLFGIVMLCGRSPVLTTPPPRPTRTMSDGR